MNKTIVVFGQSRSGTTAIMKVLGNLGINLGVLFHKTKMNPDGSLEELGIGNCLWRKERRLFPANEENIAKTVHKYFYELTDNLENTQLREEFTKKINARNEIYTDWAFKNPVFIHQWRVLVDLIRNPYFIVVKRNLEENAKSFSRWTEYNLEESLKIIKHRNTLVDSFVEESSYPKLIINHEELIEKTYESIQKIADFIGRETTREAENCIKK